MALQRDTLYAGRFNTATTAHPQGAFKNRTTSTAQDGSYLEAQWLNDWDGFFGSLLSKAGLTPNGSVDAVGASQYFNALLTVASIAPVGTSRNLKCSIPTVSTTATFTADELVLGTALNGQKYQISSLSKTINLATTGAGGMDTGSAPVSGYVAIYAIYNPTTGTSALLAYNATSVVAANIYPGSNMPSGYTASALISVWPTNSSGQLVIGYQNDRSVWTGRNIVLNTTTAQSSWTPLSISSLVPPNAKTVSGDFQCVSTGSSTVSQNGISASSTGVGSVFAGTSVVSSQGQYNLPLVTQQLLYYVGQVASGSINIITYISGYTF